jgi:hypothetical protein
MAITFAAQWDGECSRCGEDFDAGDSIGYDQEDELCCANCIEKDQEEVEQDASAWKNFTNKYPARVVARVSFRECGGVFDVLSGCCSGCEAVDTDQKGLTHTARPRLKP